MTIKFYYHPLSSFCWKVAIALYEKGVAFEPVIVNLGDQDQSAAFIKLSPMRKMPAIVNDGEVINESSIEIEWLDQNFAAPKLIPADPAQALEVRFWDRFFDVYVHYPMQRVVGDRLRPADKRDAYGVAENKAQMKNALAVIDKHMTGREWVAGASFSMADCAAAPALYYADKLAPLEAAFPNAAAYLKRLSARPSFARALEEAQPYAHMFPREEAA